MALGVTLSSCAALVRLKCRAAASKARKAFSGGAARMRKAHLYPENLSFVMQAKRSQHHEA
jgi:hypothetical protein